MTEVFSMDSSIVLVYF